MFKYFSITPLMQCKTVFSLICALFIALVAFGVTGSSVELTYKASPFVAGNLHSSVFRPRPIRSDEWLVVTPMAIGQYNHDPSFPIVNKNLGIDGQNMLIVGMTGVPVKHISLIAKPATWGFHFFDLKRALAWYWWFPVFGCFFAVWWLFNLIAPGNWRLGLFTSLIFSLSPYTIAWSNWPAYAVFFPTIALCFSILMLKQKNYLRLSVLAAGLGIALAGFVFVLYPPWQISLGFLYLSLAAALFIRDRKSLIVDWKLISAFGIAAGTATLILLAWWLDARPAIAAMLETVYPGKRVALHGGGYQLSDLLRGFTNLKSLRSSYEGPVSNQSEIASFYYLFLPIAATLILTFKNKVESRWVVFSLIIFISYSLLYMLIGVPDVFAKISMWGRIPSQRADLALGVAHVLLCGFLLTQRNIAEPPSRRLKLLFYLISFSWTVVSVLAISTFPEGIYGGIASRHAVIVLVLIFFIGYWLMAGDVKKFVIASIILYFATTFSFNPLSIAPTKINVVSNINGLFNQQKNHGLNNARVLVFGSQIPAMALMSSGVATVNGVFYYPQKTLWQRMGVEDTASDIYNRYQHLIFIFGTVKEIAGFTVESPQPDVVKVTVDPISFKFGLTSATLVVAPDEFANSLKRNLSVNFLRSDSGWSWFSVD